MKNTCYNKIIQKRFSNRFQNRHRRKGQCTKDNGIPEYNKEVGTVGQHSLKRAHQEAFDVLSSVVDM